MGIKFQVSNINQRGEKLVTSNEQLESNIKFAASSFK